jgi:hypothetical protein
MGRQDVTRRVYDEDRNRISYREQAATGMQHRCVLFELYVVMAFAASLYRANDALYLRRYCDLRNFSTPAPPA